MLITFAREQLSFTWRDSLLSDRFKQTAIMWLEYPVRWIPPRLAPSDVTWVLSEVDGRITPEAPERSADELRPAPADAPADALYPENREPSIQTEVRTPQDRRSHGALFLVKIAMFYAVLPRMVLFLFTLFLARRAWRSLSPDMKAPYCVETLAFSIPVWTVLTEPPLPPPTTNTTLGSTASRKCHNVTKPLESPHDAPSSRKVNTDTVLNERSLDARDRSLETKPNPIGEAKDLPHDGQGFPDLVVFSYLVFPKANWAELLPLPKVRVVCWDDVNGAKMRQSLLARLAREVDSHTAITMLVDETTTPDNTFIRFARSVRECGVAPAQLLVVLTNGEAMRRMLGGDPAAIKLQHSLWKRQCLMADIPPECLFEYDHVHATPQSRKLLLSRCNSTLAARIPACQSSKLYLAGKFSTAAETIRESVTRVTADFDEESRRRELFALHCRLRVVYDREARAFDTHSGQFGHSFGNAAAKVSGLAQCVASTASTIKEQGQHIVRDATRTWDTVKNMPRWGAGGAMAGLALGAMSVAVTVSGLPVLVAVPLAGYQLIGGAALGGLIAAAMPMALRVAWSKLSGTAFGDSLNDTEDAPAATPSLDLDDFVRSSVLLALILELQGNSQDTIAATINLAVGDLADERLTSLTAIESLIRTINDRLLSWPVHSN